MTERILTEAERRLAMTDEERAEARARWGRVMIEGDRGAIFKGKVHR